MNDTGKLEKEFSKNLKAYLDSQPRGTIAKLAKELNVQPGSVSNWANGQRESTETQRREIANHIGIRYETMIGLESPEPQDKRFKKIIGYINKFKNIEKCITAISNLQKIEEIDRRTFFRMVNEIEDMRYTLEEKKEKNQKLSEPFLNIDSTPIMKYEKESKTTPVDPELPKA